ncbi:MAG: isopenicillin N-epimerase [Pseudomonadota bacterium]
MALLWSLDFRLTFLNNGSYGAVPIRIQHFRNSVLEEIEKNPVKFLSRDLPERLDEQRLSLARWLEADAEGIAFTQNATSGIGSVLRSLNFAPGDEVVFHDHGYRWVRQGLENLARHSGVVIKTAAVSWPSATNEQVITAFDRLIGSKTKLVICDHISSPTALVFPVAELVALARAKGVPILVDGAHAPGALELKLGHLNPDFYVGNLHKWACAPRGTAFIYVGQEHRSVIRPESLSYCGGQGHFQSGTRLSDFFHWNGTTDYSGWLSTTEALAFNEELGWDQLFRNRKSMLEKVKTLFQQELIGIGQYLQPAVMQGPMWTFEFPLKQQVTPSAENAQLIAGDLYRFDQIEVPVFYFKNGIYIRVSAQAFNKLSDYERLLKALLAHRLLAAREGIR